MDMETILNKAGGKSNVARACSISRQAIQQWVDVNRVPFSDIAGRTRYAAIISKLAKDRGHNIEPIDICPGAPQYMQHPDAEAA